VDPAVALAVFPVIFLGELPDKTMFASLVMATKARPRAVWLGAAGAFCVHVGIAVTVGAGFAHLVNRRLVDAVVAVLLFGGAAYALIERRRDADEDLVEQVVGGRRVVTTAFVVIFVAEWGDLTQVLTAELAARYRSPLSVGVGAVLALWAVAAVAVVGGQSVLRWVSMATVRTVTAVALAVLGSFAAWSAFR